MKALDERCLVNNNTDFNNLIEAFLQLPTEQIRNEEIYNRLDELQNTINEIHVSKDNSSVKFTELLYCGIKKFCNFAREFISQLRKGNRRTQAIDALRLLLF